MKSAEQRRRDIMNVIANYRPIDNDFMRELFRDNPELAREVIRIITDLELTIVSEQIQYDISRPGSRAVCLDVLCVDNMGRLYNIEIQRSMDNMPPQRPRYHISMMDVDFLKPGDDFSDLPIIYSIIICEDDPFGKGSLLYVFERRERNSNFPLNDGTVIIYLNCSYHNPADKSEKAALAHDFLCKNPDDMLNPVLAQSARFYKVDTKGASLMCNTMEELMDEVTKDVTKKVTKETKKSTLVEVATKMLASGIMVNQIADITGLTVGEIQNIAAAMD